ncbi:predicted protein [Aspergillus terreus NIH2624]|uniref:Rhodopsin domain-containing protein n=1 Tax=Aspergillus terreus (strain NIH 2624 / FGSC A1156) TaxID=341663 RepID=Q0CWK7_ASPTN|nr:uncharacterized protein ATEG_01927 [Aspergillus terreus NIH2624]EAU36889.1 predicted protein [Aspergillus terreus NIH2624]
MSAHDGKPTDDKGPKILAVLWTLTAITTVIVVARMYIRSCLLRNVGADDYLICVSLFLGLVYCGITTGNVLIGYGKHAWVLEEKTVELASLLNSVSFLFGILSFALPKLAVTAMLTKILNPPFVHRVALWILVGTAAAVSCICILVLFTMCDPPEGLWKTSMVAKGEATCRDVWILIDYAIFTGAISAFVDLCLAIYPTTILMKLHMSLRKRLALCAALGLGAIASAMAIVKCTQLKGLADRSDYTYGTADLVMWTNIESDVVIIASCIPTLQPVLELITGKRTKSSYSNRYKGSHNLPDSSFDRPSKTPRKSDLAITNVDSQESILRSDELQNSHPLGTIRRTDNVTVEYESHPAPGAANERTSW